MSTTQKIKECLKKKVIDKLCVLVFTGNTKSDCEDSDKSVDDNSDAEKQYLLFVC